MPLTKEFKDTVMALCQNPEYRLHLLTEALEAYLENDIAVGNALMRDYLNATQTFSEIAGKLQVKESSLRRMVSQQGNATAKNLFNLFKVCQEREGVKSAQEFLRRAS